MDNINYLFTISDLRKDLVPLYGPLDDKDEPTGAILCLDEDGNVFIDYGYLPNSFTKLEMKIFYRQTIIWRLPPVVRGEAMANFMEDESIVALLNKVHAGHDVVDYDESIRVGVLSKDATEACSTLNDRIKELAAADFCTQ